MEVGIIGKPSSGKSTFFKAATLAEVEISSRPFTTIKPNHAVGFVKVDCVDKEFNIQCNPREGYCVNGIRFVPIDLIDVAGIIEGAHEGRGLGLQFLNDLNQADVLIHIVDISGSTNEKGELVPPLTHDPIKDVLFLEKEIDYWFLSVVKKGWDKFTRTIRGENQNIKQAIAKQLSGLKVTEEIAEEAIKELKLTHHPTEWSEDDLFALATQLRKKTKPIIIAANKIDVEGAEFNLHKMKQEFPDLTIVPCSAEAELALREAAKNKLIEYTPGTSSFKMISGKITDNQRHALEFMRENVLEKFGSTGVQDILDKTIFDFLKYIAVFPGGLNNLKDKDGRYIPDCFLLKEGSTALDFAFRLHTDIGKNFIKAINVKKKLAVGKDYLLKHRDVIEIKTSA